MSAGTWSLAAIEDRGRDLAVALLPGGEIITLPAIPEGLSPLDLLKRWEEFAPALQAWDPTVGEVLEGARLVAPIRFPSKLICIGANFRDHRAEMDSERGPEGAPGNVFMFLKPPTTAIVGPDDEVLIRGPGDKVDWEAEIGVVIGKGGRFIDAAEALDHVAGYLLVNDISARGVFQQADGCHPAVEYDWLAQKAQDTHCPIGPAMTPAWFVPDAGDIPFALTVNGVEEQNGNTGELIHDIPAIISAASQYMTLEPGDIIATGTCGGVGLAKGRFLADGDVVVVSSPLLGELTNIIRDIWNLK
jgi:2-keto-4-pentenoate hydratase/2-oxohepta-3-ene-1,7-dioic acid hydratase in catechol pathway